MTGYLLLEDGTVFEGRLHGKCETVIGEMNFYTHMAGYENLFTDAANIDKIMVMTYPIIGNYGFMAVDYNGYKYKPKGIVVKEFSEFPSHYQCEKSIFDFLNEMEITGLSHIDTRHVARIIRDYGSMKVMITAEEITDAHIDVLRASACSNNSVKESVEDYTFVKSKGLKNIVIISLGSKDSLVNQLSDIGADIHICPYTYNVEKILDLNPDMVIVSHGGEDMGALEGVSQTIAELKDRVPVYGIGSGALAMAMALGCELYKMPNGHRGSNYPVLHKESGKVLITNQNIGYAIVKEAVPGNIEITYENVNDGNAEGFVSHNCEGILFLPEYDYIENKNNEILIQWVKGGDYNA